MSAVASGERCRTREIALEVIPYSAAISVW